MPATAELLQKGRYRIDSPSPEPGSNAVYQAYDTSSDSKVFVKEIVVRLGKVTTLSQQENMRVAFENAARRMTEFHHDALLQVKDSYTEAGRQYIVLENVDGDDFQTLLDKNQRPYDVGDVLDWADQLLDAVNYLHNQKPSIIHKNIKPRNVKLALNGKVKLLSVSVTDDSGNEISTGFNEADAGTLNYSPLELIWDGLDAASQKVITNSYDDRSERTLKSPADARSDLYSVGATLYYLLTATVPVDPLERSIELLEGNTDPLKAPAKVDSRIAPEISDVVMRAMEIKRENRFDSASIMRQVLRTAVVRVKEREASEAEEMEDAAEVLRNTQQLRMPQAAQPPVAAEPEKPAVVEAPAQTGPSEAEILAQKLREVEEMRLEAERRAAEAEKLLKEREAEAKAAAHVSVEPAAPAIAPEDDLLGLSGTPAVHTSGAPDAEPDEDIHLSMKPQGRSSAKFEAKPSPFEQATKTIAPEPQAKVEQPVVAKPEPEPAVEVQATYTEPEYVEESKPVETAAKVEAADSYDSIAYADQPKRGLPIPAIAGGAVLLIVIAVVGFMFMGGSSGSTPAEQTQTQPAAAQPATDAPASDNAADDQQQPTNAFADAPPTGEQTPDAATAAQKQGAKPAPTPKKPTTEKTPAAKKPVTVDDLINDN